MSTLSFSVVCLSVAQVGPTVAFSDVKYRLLPSSIQSTFMSSNWFKWHYELQNASKCVVGEAYGYSSQYTADCNESNTICVKFLYYFTLNLRGKLESNKQDFVKHWNEEHNKGISLLLGHAEKRADK